MSATIFFENHRLICEKPPFFTYNLSIFAKKVQSFLLSKIQQIQSYPTIFRLIRPNIPRTRVYARLRGDGKGQYVFISWSRGDLSRLAKNSARLGWGLLERTMQGLPAMAFSMLESHWTTLSATDSNRILPGVVFKRTTDVPLSSFISG